MNGKRSVLIALATLGVMAITPAARAADAAVEGVTFAEAPGTIYAPVREVADALGWPVGWDAGSRTVYLNNVPFHGEGQKRLWDGTLIAPAAELRRLGANVAYDADAGAALVSVGDRSVAVKDGAKRTEIDLSGQELRAIQGDRVVLKSPISSGAAGKRTPRGTWEAGPYKARMHYSSLYDNAPMPFSVQVTGNIFVHGFRSVPDQPASAGCIRLPLDGDNPARFFYRWVGVGTPVTVEGRWQG